MTDRVSIRRAEPADKDECLRMRLALWPDTSPEGHLREMAENEADEIQAVFVAVRPDGNLGGFLEASQRKYADGCETSPIGYIEGWYVDPDLRGQDIGGALVRAAEDWARARGLKEMASDCKIENEASRRAHLALGYEETERLIYFKKRLDV